jgi:hypothetical protein
MSPAVLVCAPSVRTLSQRELYDAWRKLIRAQGFSVNCLERTQYATDPWEQLTRLMNQADGVVVLGFRQMQIRDGLWRSETPEMSTVNAVWTSPWMHIEAGMAIASGKPVLAAPETGVCEGIFAPQNWTANVFGTPVESLRSHIVQRWAAMVRNGQPARSLAHPPDLRKSSSPRRLLRGEDQFSLR